MLYEFCPKCGSKYKQQADENRFVCSNCSFVFYLNSKPTASTLIVKGNKVLLGKRRIEPAKGKWDVIGGFLEHGEHPEEGARREAKEETGLDIEIQYLLGFFMDIYGNADDSTLNICFVVKVKGGDLQPGDDIEELNWFSPEELPREIAFKNGQEMIDAWLKSQKM